MITNRVYLHSKSYTEEELYDLPRDMEEMYDEAYNPSAKFLPEDIPPNGVFVVTVIYMEEE